MIFYTADLHLGYFPILHDTARPFSGVPEMDEALISNWNARVGADDSVYIVGDFSYNGGEAPTQYLSRLNGRLHLIRGNHDTGLNHAERLLDYCDSVTDFLEIDDGGTHILLCHYPILHEKGGYMIHGHIHNQRNHAYEILKTLPRVLNAGVDINFYRPHAAQAGLPPAPAEALICVSAMRTRKFPCTIADRAMLPDLSLRGGRRPTWQSHATAYGFAEAALLSDRALQDCHVASLLAMTHQGGAAVHQCSCAVELP